MGAYVRGSMQASVLMYYKCLCAVQTVFMLCVCVCVSVCLFQQTGDIIEYLCRLSKTSVPEGIISFIKVCVCVCAWCLSYLCMCPCFLEVPCMRLSLLLTSSCAQRARGR